ncbi:MAG: peptidase C45 [Oligosphaeraceae bacterium]|nr:peptidase C45 [Oligosphaeraceae bacterium]
MSARSLLFLFVFLFNIVVFGQEPRIIARDPHGLLAETEGRRILFMAGNPEQMGAAHGRLLASPIPQVTPRTVALVAGGYYFSTGKWFYDRLAEILARSQPHTPERFLQECLAMGQAAGISERDALYGNFFPELFHCSGVAVKGSATADGEVLHARVLDYMADINLQKFALLQVFMPNDFNAWLSVGYASFVGTVTAINEHGLAIGEMGGRGEGQWDGMPMAFLLRDIMERAKTVREAIEIFKNTPRTCEYYYVISDRSGDMVGVYATPNILQILEAGEQHPQLPQVPKDTVMISAGDRAKVLSERLHEKFGDITPQLMIDIIRRPVAMRSNLHNAIFKPATLDVWFAHAGTRSPACDMPYTQVNLGKLIEFYRANSNQ